MEMILDESDNKVVMISDIIFTNKQNIDWNEVESYLKQYIGEIVVMAESRDVIYLGRNFPDEFTRSKYTRMIKGARAKAKANAAQGIREMLKAATNKTFRINHKKKRVTHSRL